MLSVLTSRDLEAFAQAYRPVPDRLCPPIGWFGVALAARPGPPDGVTDSSELRHPAHGEAPPALVSRWAHIPETADRRVAGMVMYFQEPCDAGWPDLDFMPTVWLFAKVNGAYIEQMRVQWQPDWLPPLRGDEWLHWYFRIVTGRGNPYSALRVWGADVERDPLEPKISFYLDEDDPNSVRECLAYLSAPRPDGPRISNPYAGPPQGSSPSSVLTAVIAALDGMLVGDGVWDPRPDVRWDVSMLYDTSCFPTLHKSSPRIAHKCGVSRDFFTKNFEDRCGPEVYVVSFPCRRNRVFAKHPPDMHSKRKSGIQSLRAMATAALIDGCRSVIAPVSVAQLKLAVTSYGLPYRCLQSLGFHSSIEALAWLHWNTSLLPSKALDFPPAYYANWRALQRENRCS